MIRDMMFYKEDTNYYIGGYYADNAKEKQTLLKSLLKAGYVCKLIHYSPDYDAKWTGKQRTEQYRIYKKNGKRVNTIKPIERVIYNWMTHTD